MGPRARRAVRALPALVRGARRRGRHTLVHGDLHHHNVLRSKRGWLAIDPKPMLGEPEYDVASFLWNPLPCRVRVEHLETRLAAFGSRPGRDR